MLMQCLILITCVVLGPRASRATSQVSEVTTGSGVISSSGENNVSTSTEWIFSPNKTYNALKLEFLDVNISSSVECRDAYLELLNGTKYCGEKAANLSTNCHIYNFASTYNESCAGSCKYIQMNLTEHFIIKYFDSVRTSSFRLQYELYRCHTEQQATTPMPTTPAVTATTSATSTVSTISVGNASSLATVIVVCAVMVVIIGFGIALIIWNRKKRNTETHTVPPIMPRTDPRPQQTRPENSIKQKRDVDYLTMVEINSPPSGTIGSPKSRPKHKKAGGRDDDYLLMKPVEPLREVPKYENLAFEGGSSTGSNSVPTTPPHYDNVDFTPSPNRAQDIKMRTDNPSNGHEDKAVTDEKSQELSPDDENYNVNTEIRQKPAKTGLNRLELEETDMADENSSSPSENSLDNSRSETSQATVAASSPEPDRTGSYRLDNQDSDNKVEQPKMTPIALELYQKRPNETGSTPPKQDTKQLHTKSSQSKPKTGETDRFNMDTRRDDRHQNARSEDDPVGLYPLPRVPLPILQNINSHDNSDETLSEKYLNPPPTPPSRDMGDDTPTGQDPGSPPLPSRNLLLGDDDLTPPSRDLLFEKDPNTRTSSDINPDAPILPPRALSPGVDTTQNDSFEKDSNATSLPTRDLLLGEDPNENGPAEEDPNAPSLPPRDLILEDGLNEIGPVEEEPDAPALPPRIFSPGFRHANHPAYDMWG